MRRLEKSATQAAAAAMTAAAQRLLADSVDMVPFQKGFSGGLASTASQSKPTVTANKVEVEVGFNKVYATKLHEDMNLKISQENTQGGQTRRQKYLETPMKENGNRYAKIMRDTIAKRLKK